MDFLEAELSSNACESLVENLKKCDKRISQLLSNTNGQPTISCRKCDTTGVEGSARAFLVNSRPLEIVLCTNKLKESSVKEALIHELIHAYDFSQSRCDFSTCEGLAYSEVRAAREAECGRSFPFDWIKNTCVEHHAINSTKNMCPAEANRSVNKVFSRAMADQSPFDSEK